MQKFLSVLLLGLLVFHTTQAQQPKKLNAVEIHEAIKKLNFLGSALYIAAHPDDENTRLIAYLANQVKARTAYLSLTRGDGGQNLIGSEIRELLGVIRTQELLAARRTDGGEQFFTRANDFGYSKHPDETLSIWNKTKVLSDVVWAIRKFQPDVIINRFDHRTPGSTHGHHTSSAILSTEAFDLAADPKKYPDQLAFVDTWKPKRLFFNTSWWFYGSKENFEKADKSNLLELDTGVYYPTLGISNSEIASLSRSQHKSQGFGSTGTRGIQKEYIELIKGELPKDKTDLFEGIDTSWNRVKGGKEIGALLEEVEKNFDFTNPAASVPQLVTAYKLIQQLNNSHWRTVKSKEIKEIIASSLGLYLEAAATEPTATKESTATIKVEMINRSAVPVKVVAFSIKALDILESSEVLLTNNARQDFEFKGKIPSDISYTSPYWLQKKGTLGMYEVEDPLLIGIPETPRVLTANFKTEINGVLIPFEKEVIYKTNDPVKGEVYKPFEIIPKVAVSISDKVIIFEDNTPKSISVTITSGTDTITGKARLDIPSNWKVVPEEAEFLIAAKGEEKVLHFTVTPPDEQSEAFLSPKVIIGDHTYTDEVVHIDYEHIPYQTVLVPAEVKIVKLDIQKKGQNIGYIEGAGDTVPESLTQIGYQVTIIDPSSISDQTLQPFDAIVMGIRAYNTINELKFKQQYLLDYVKNGGNLIVQYNTNRRLKVNGNLGPYPFKLSRDRVTDENANISILSKDHPVLNTPNKITQKDFEGWVQERGLYFPNEWSEEYTPIIAASDKGEPTKKGALLIAEYGKGYYIYTGLSFFREFPAGVPGAYRLFANMLSLGK